jgi:pyruvate formate lyase activating enzyme
MKCTEVCPSAALERVGTLMTVSAVMDEVIRDVPFYDTSGGGITVSGGEPTLQAAFTAELLKRAKMQSIHTCLETNGHAKSEVWKSMLPYLDLILMDIKHMDPVIHEKFTGVSNELILNNVRDLASQKEIIIRVPLIPGFNDSRQFVEALGNFLSPIPLIKEVHLIPVHGYGSSKYIMLGKKADIYPALNPLSLGNKVEDFKEHLEKCGVLVRVLK